MSSTFKNLKFMQRAAQRDEKTAKILEETVSDMNLFFYGPSKRCVVIMEGDPHPPITGRLSFDPGSTGNNGGLKRKQTGEDCEALYPNKLPKNSENGLRLSEETLAPGRKVHVRGIPFYSSEDDVRSYFEGCGIIARLHCMKSPESGKFTGTAIIKFKTEEGAKRALALDGSDMGGLHLRIQSSKSVRANKASPFAPAIVERYNRIFLGNMSWEITEDDLRDLFSDCAITSVRIGKDKRTGECKGYGHVDFADCESVKTALKLDQNIVCGRPIRIRCDVAKKQAVTGSTPFQQKTISNQLNRQGSKRPEPNANFYQPRSNGTNVVAPEYVSWKIKRRTCFKCGEKGHLSSACLLEQPTDQANKGAVTSSTSFLQKTIPNQLKSEDSEPPEPNTNSNQHKSNGTEVTPVPVRWKICYECKEAGHIASACPKKQPTDQANKGAVTSSTPFQQKTISNQLKSEDSKPREPNTHSNKQRSNGTNEVTPVPVSWKIDWRICYECRERGHISSACPKKQPSNEAKK